MAYDSTDFVVTDVPVAPSVKHPERIVAIRDAILRHPRDFNMRAAQEHSCGSPACIFGFGKAVFRRPEGWSSREFGEFIGLSPQQTVDLFQMAPGNMEATQFCPSRTTARQGANVLDHYLATGKIDWSVA